MTNIEGKAEMLINQAEKKLAPLGFFQSLFSSSTRDEEAIDCYQRAGNLLRVAKNWPKAAKCFTKCAELSYKRGDKYEAADHYSSSAICFKKFQISDAVQSLLKAAEIYTDFGRFANAAKIHHSIAEIYEGQLLDLEQARQHYEQASDFYRADDRNSCGDKCLLKAAHYSAMLEDYQKAIEIYQQVALSHMSNSLLKYSVKDYLFKSAVCHMCVDRSSVQFILERYTLLFPLFSESPEFKFLNSLTSFINDNDVDGFAKTIENYEKVSRLDEWTITLLLRVKKQFEEVIDLR